MWLRKDHNSNNLISIFLEIIIILGKKYFPPTSYSVIQIMKEMYTQGSRSNKINNSYCIIKDIK